MEALRRLGAVAAFLGLAAGLGGCEASWTEPSPRVAGQRRELSGHPRLYFSPSDYPALSAQTASGVPASARGALSRFCTFAPPDGGVGTGLDSKWAKCSEEAALRSILDQNANYGSSALANLLDAAGEDATAYWSSLAANNHSVYWVGNKVGAMASAYDFLGAHAAMTAGQQAAIRAELEEYASLLYGFTGRGANDAVGNYDVSAYAALGLVALVLDGESTHPDRAAWLAAAERHLALDVFNDLWNPGGLYQEGYGYSAYGSPLAIRFAIALKRHTGRDLLAGANILGAPDWMTWGYLPHGEHLAFADAHKLNGPAYAGEYLHLVGLTQNAAAKWGWHEVHGVSGLDRLDYALDISTTLGVALWYPTPLTTPADPAAAGRPHDVWFGDTLNGAQRLEFVGSTPAKGGLGVFRAGWGADTVAATLTVSDEWPGNHSHADSHSFTLSAYGAALALDLGYGDSTTSDRKRASVHNRVFASCCEDGASFRRSNRGELVDFFSAHVGGYARGDGRYPLGSFNWANGTGWDDPSQWNPLTKGDRALLLIRGAHPYVILADELEDAQARNFRWQSYVPNPGTPSGTGSPASPLVLPSGGQPRLELTFLEPSGAAPSVVQVPAADIGQLTSQRRVELTRTGTAARFLTLLYPRKSATSPERPSVSVPAVTGGMGAVLAWSDGTESLVYRTGAASTVSGGPLSTNGRLAWVRTGTSSQLLGLLATEVDAVSLSGQALVELQGGRGDVASAAGRVEVRAPGLTRLRVWGPGASTLVLNQQGVAFRQVGDFVEWPVPGGGDGGAPVDAGAAMDGGSGGDGGTSGDGGAGEGDAGAVDEDGGWPADAGPGADGGAEHGSADSGTAGSAVAGGCGCQEAAPGALGFGFLAALEAMRRATAGRRRAREGFRPTLP